MADNKLPSGIDRVVGQRIRWRRKELKLTQEKLGELLGLTFQQVQKYEKGVNRVSAGRLFEMSTAMGVPITYFFDGAETFLDHD
ncbi:helix-turn-helix domain-containing protein, partial [Hyphomonas sp. UBA4508]